MSETSSYKKPTAQELKSRLTAEQYLCTQEDGTERPFDNAYWNHKADGIYVDIVTGEPLFYSTDKFDSGTGWPSFTRPVEDQRISRKVDRKLGMERVEVRSSAGDSHLGHVFDDGPPAEGGLRYCINSASLQFIPVTEMKEKGYGKHLFPFAKKMGWEIATLAGGCFWGVEELLRAEKGVIETRVGYTGGGMVNPTYSDVKTGTTQHAEAVQILFDPKQTTYENLLELFFKLHDPTTTDRQGNDRGTQYRSAIFFESDPQQISAKKTIDRVQKSKAWTGPIVTQVVPLQKFWPAEEFHQDYLQKNPGGYTCHFVRKIDF